MNTVNLYDRDVAILKDYNGNGSKIILCNALRKKGFEFDNNAKYRCEINEKKLDENIIRAKSRVKELALCNPWEYFVTLTIDPKKYDRTKLENYYKDFSQWLRDYRKKYNCDIKYLFIPELHKDGVSWHMHGFLMGLPMEHLTDNIHGYLDWKPYQIKFGYCSIDYIHDKAKCSNYITKYISKDLDKSVTKLNSKMYYCSHGLKKATQIKKGQLICEMSNPHFENDYVKIINYDANISIDYLSSLID